VIAHINFVYGSLVNGQLTICSTFGYIDGATGKSMLLHDEMLHQISPVTAIIQNVNDKGRVKQ